MEKMTVQLNFRYKNQKNVINAQKFTKMSWISSIQIVLKGVLLVDMVFEIGIVYDMKHFICGVCTECRKNWYITSYFFHKSCLFQVVHCATIGNGDSSGDINGNASGNRRSQIVIYLMEETKKWQSGFICSAKAT